MEGIEIERWFVITFLQVWFTGLEEVRILFSSTRFIFAKQHYSSFPAHSTHLNTPFKSDDTHPAPPFPR